MHQSFEKVFETEVQQWQVMVNVSVRFLSRIQELLGTKRLEIAVEEGNITSLLKTLCDNLGEPFVNVIYDPMTSELKNDISIMVNGRNIVTIEGVETKLRDGDVVVLLTPVAGGCLHIREEG